MSVDELETRLSNLRSTLAKAKKQLSAAKTLSHSSIDTEKSNKQSRKESIKMGPDKTPDFGGYATRSDVECTDGRTILPNAFEHQDGVTVPLVYQHGHDDIENVLGHCVLENRPDGVYAHAKFNGTPKAQLAKEMVAHGDLKFLSIFANNLRESMKQVAHGNIREVSLVLAGANKGAFIDNINIVHSDGESEVTGDALIFMNVEIDLAHAETDTKVDDEEELDLAEIVDSFNEKQRTAFEYLLGQALTGAEQDLEHSDSDDEDDDDEENPDGEVDGEDEENSDEDSEDETDDEDNAVQHNDNQEDNSMTHNVFDKSRTAAHKQITLSHSDVKGIVADAIKRGDLKSAVEDYALQHGVENIDLLFPDAKLLETSPQFISRRMEWVDKVLSSVRKSPFSRIKTITADITPDEARARGYITGEFKNEEYFALAKRETTPQTIYKKQRLDRDDVVDIVDLDVVAWLKAEMKVMLEEELAGAILVGDGRSLGDPDKIKEINIRPVATDAELYVTTAYVNLDDANSSIEELVDSAIESRKYYKGTGQPSFYTSESVISAFLTVKDNFGRRIYSNLQDVANVLRVSEVVPVEIMERDETLVGIMVNLADYTLGADKGGQATMFDDFNIDYNKLIYLIETRCSGALTQPKSAIVFRRTAAADVLAKPVKPTVADNVVTVPTITGVVYKNAETDTTLTTGSPVTLTEVDDELYVKAVPDTNYYFATNADDEWVFTYKAD